MPQHQKNPQCLYGQCFQTCSEIKDMEVVQVSKALEETHLSSYPLMPGNSKEAPDAGRPSTPESHQSFCSSSIALTTTSSSEMNEGFSSQEEENSTSWAGPDSRSVPTNALDEKVISLVNFMLFKYHMKRPMTKADMKIVINECEDHFTEIFLRASEHMEMVFGLDVKRVDPTNHCYGLFIKLGLTYDGVLDGEEGMPKTGILIFILGVVFMKGNSATEEEVWGVLSLTGIHAGRKHVIFGEPRKLITKDFVKEKYLEYRQVANSDPARFEFLWGPRAHAETTKMRVLEFLAKVHGTDPSSFPSQYEEALQDEEERARARISARSVSASVATASSRAKSSHFSCS
ncbi:LOW QUALITY PROTEIN: melanoma-associated antigen B16-like [Ursus americanus]|uniref:LOW QUALITY PROTEIN: melanoma-associated antigen B16-like n=1 Tax=Ursus americanus TaxID=9643 RepID=UPI001E6792C6|nr:LOW QUALITY PROTEIN: melanoma-associated antigen B16-like [Ursus americanus]